MFSCTIGLNWPAPGMSSGGGWLPGLSLRLDPGDAVGVLPGECNGEAPADKDPEMK